MRRGIWAVTFLLAALAVILVVPPRAVYSQRSADDGLSWTKGYSLVLTTNTTYQQANEAVDFIQATGGQIAIVVSPRVMLGWTPSNIGAPLIGRHGIRAIHQRPVTNEVFARESPNVDEAASVSFFNKVASGELRQEKAPLANHGRVPSWPSDALEPPQREGAPGSPSQSPGNSDMMVGKVSFNAIFVESVGGIDPNIYTWLCSDVDIMVGEVSVSLSRWAAWALNYGVPLTWTTTYYRPPQCPGGTTIVTTNYEPITRAGPVSDSLWINQIMAKVGGCAGCAIGDKFARTNAFNTYRRTATVTNWATTSFIGYNPFPAPTTFTNGYFAYAYRSGHYSHLLFRNDGWSIAQYDLVNSHETGHLFGAFDEYASSGCGNCFTSDSASKNVINGNCANCNAGSAACIMRNNEVSLCGYTPGQVGWGVDYNYVRTVNSSFLEKTNWKPGQEIRYLINVDVPGRSGECVTVHSRWYRHFQPNINEVETFIQPCIWMTGGNRQLVITRTVPAGAQYGEASLEVQLEIKYAAAPNIYGKGTRGSSRGRFYVLPTAANTIPSSQPLEGPPVAVTAIE